MKRPTRSRARLVVVAGLLASLLATPAFAKDMRGKLGVGASRTLAGAQGVAIRYWASRSVGVEAIVGVSFVSRRDDTTGAGVVGALQVMYVLRELGRANLVIGLRGDVGYRKDAVSTPGATANDPGATKDVSIVHFAVELPLTVEYHFADSFSMHLGLGLVLSFVPDEGKVLSAGPLLNGLSEDPGLAVGFGAPGLFGEAGFSFYF